MLQSECLDRLLIDLSCRVYLQSFELAHALKVFEESIAFVGAGA